MKNARGAESYARSITFRNEASSNNLKVGLGGTAVISLLPGTSFTVPGEINQFTISSSAATVAWTAVATVA